MKGDKIVAFCDRRCNVIAPFVSAPGNHNESPLLRFERIRELYYALKSLAYTMINLRHFCQR